MAKERDVATGMKLLQELVRFDIYKPSQGKITRQVTLGALAVVLLLAALQLYRYLDANAEIRWLIIGAPALLLAVGLWVSYRIMNYPYFADFLIAVEAEMNKVSWPTQTELFRSSLVVIVVLFLLAVMLFAFDIFWQWLFNLLGILRQQPPQ